MKFIYLISVIISTYALILLYSSRNTLTKEHRTTWNPNELEMYQIELDYRKHWAQLLLILCFLMILPTLLMW